MRVARGTGFAAGAATMRALDGAHSLRASILQHVQARKLAFAATGLYFLGGSFLPGQGAARKHNASAPHAPRREGGYFTLRRK